jgi:hypothetical protein
MLRLKSIRPIGGSPMSLYAFDDGVEYIHVAEIASAIGYSNKNGAKRFLDRFDADKIEVTRAAVFVMRRHNPALMAKCFKAVAIIPARCALDRLDLFVGRFREPFAGRIRDLFELVEKALDPTPRQGDLIDIAPRLEAKAAPPAPSTPAPDDLDVEVIFDEPEAAPVQATSSPVADPMALIRSGMEILSALGGLEARDKLMLRDATRNIIARHAGIALNSTPSVGATGYGVGNRLVELGYRYSLDVVKIIGRRVAARYRRAFNAEPQTCKRWIDGEERDVNFYVKPEAVAMLDDEIHAYFREVGS